MSISFRVDTASECVFAESRSDVSDTDLILYTQALAADPTHGPDFDQLLDFRKAAGLSVSPEGLHSVAELVRQYGERVGDCKCAIVVSSMTALTAVHQFDTYASDVLVLGVFTHLEEARQWLGI